jgi:hypothetical protein
MKDNRRRIATMIERRVATRQRVLKQGTLAFGGGGGVDCMVRNISSSGARIDIASPVGLPRSFTLVIKTDHFLRRCHPVWSKDTRVGVAFD